MMTALSATGILMIVIAEIEDYVEKRIELLDANGLHEVAFALGHGKTRKPGRANGGKSVTFTSAEQRELRRLCVDARYRGRVWARSWIDAVQSGWLCVIEQGVPQTADEVTMRRLLQMIPNDLLLCAGRPQREDRLRWYEDGLIPYARPNFDAGAKKGAFRELVAFFDAVFVRIDARGAALKDVRRLAHLEAEVVWAFVIEGSGIGIDTTRAGVGRRESKAGLSKRHRPTM